MDERRFGDVGFWWLRRVSFGCRGLVFGVGVFDGNDFRWKGSVSIFFLFVESVVFREV